MYQLIPLVSLFLAAPPASNNLLGPVASASGRHFLLGELAPMDPFDAAHAARALVELPLHRPRRLPLGPEMPIHLAMLWPAEVEKLEGLKLFTPTKYTQRLAITDNRSTNFLYRIDQDDVFVNSPTTVNPNRVFPYATPGGLHNSTGWQAMRAARIPGPVRIWTEGVPVPGTSTPLPKVRWSFPAGTVFVDMLYKDGKCFELRTATKGDDGKWDHKPLYRDLDAAPANFHGAGMACASCHKDAGASLNYGITVRGDDRVFSWTPFMDGTFQRRSDVEFVNGRMDLKGAQPATVMRTSMAPPAPVIVATPKVCTT